MYFLLSGHSCVSRLSNIQSLQSGNMPILYHIIYTSPWSKDMMDSVEWALSVDISIHSLRGGRRLEIPMNSQNRNFNPPLPPCGGDSKNRRPSQVIFNPLPPCGGRLHKTHQILQDKISIHSLRVEGDLQLEKLRRSTIFQSTPSVWEGDFDSNRYLSHNLISIHSLRGRGD